MENLKIPKQSNKENSVSGRRSTSQQNPFKDQIVLGMKKVAQLVFNESEYQVEVEVGTKKSLWIKEFEDSSQPSQIEKKCTAYLKFSDPGLNNYIEQIIDYVQINDDIINPKAFGPDGLQGSQLKKNATYTVFVKFVKGITATREPVFVGKFSCNQPPQKVPIEVN